MLNVTTIRYLACTLQMHVLFADLAPGCQELTEENYLSQSQQTSIKSSIHACLYSTAVTMLQRHITPLAVSWEL